MDHFEFTVDDEETITEMNCPPAGYFVEEPRASAVSWANGEKTGGTLSSIRNGRGNNVSLPQFVNLWLGQPQNAVAGRYVVTSLLTVQGLATDRHRNS